MLEKFDPIKHYSRKKERIAGKEAGDRVELGVHGQILLTKYNKEKFNFKLSESSDQRFTAEIMELQKKSKDEKDYREAVIINEGMDHGTTLTYHHSYLILYVKENNAEAILIIDGQGTKQKHRDLANQIWESTQISSYSIKVPFQKDDYSCHTISYVLAREIMAITDLLSQIKNRGVTKDDSSEHLYYFKMLDELLKIAQDPEFITKHREDESNKKIVHKKKNETLTLFHDRFNYAINKGAPNERVIYDYLRQKSLKYADVIAIQFYLDQFKARNYSVEDTKDFIDQAKKILRNKDDKNYAGRLDKLYAFANDFVADRNKAKPQM